uniref:Putative steroid monooxygenase n=1 Tax=Griffithsia japonica TaxID=83288 RepID=Q7XZ55_GRIJA|nr:putative steroid monooxygenase [Griffithsia japonica]
MDQTPNSALDVIVVGAGFAGLCALIRLRQRGLSVLALEAASDVGGTWFFNCYPGAQCDAASIDYSFSFDATLDREWEWSERFARQPELLRYLRHVAERHDVRRYIRFNTRVVAASWNEGASEWIVGTHRVLDPEVEAIHAARNDVTVMESAESILRARFIVFATGSHSLPKPVDVPGAASFLGTSLRTSCWPRGEAGQGVVPGPPDSCDRDRVVRRTCGA